MAVPTLSNIQTANASISAGTTLTISGYTPTAGASKLWVPAGVKDKNLTWNFTGVTYNGNALSFINGDLFDSGASRVRVGQWFLDDPLSLAASGDVVLTLDTSLTYDVAQLYAVSVMGAASGAPGAAEKSTVAAGSGNLSTSVTPDTDDSLVASIVASSSVSANPSPTAPHVQDATLQLSGDLESAIGHTDVATAALTTVEWALSAGNRRVLCVCAFNPAPAATSILKQMLQHHGG